MCVCVCVCVCVSVSVSVSEWVSEWVSVWVCVHVTYFQSQYEKNLLCAPFGHPEKVFRDSCCFLGFVDMFDFNN